MSDMIRAGKRLAAQTTFYRNQVDFWLADYDMGGKQRIATSVIFEDLPEGMAANSAFSLSLDVTQELFEQLWAQGFRPKHGAGGTVELDAARKEHIADLRKAAKLA